MKFFVIKSKTIKFVMVVLLAAILLAINFSGSGAQAMVYFGSAPRKVPIYSVETESKQVAISFDSAWGADKTLQILDILKEFDANATFFLVGFWVEEYPEMVKALSDGGIELATHSNTHADFTKLSQDEMELELNTSVKLIEDITGKPVEYFRSPFGAYNDLSIETASNLGLTTIQWDVDSLDWKGLSAQDISDRVINNVQNGSIILCHNNADNILEALPLMLTTLTNMGYEITSVGDLVIKSDYYVDNLGIQRQN